MKIVAPAAVLLSLLLGAVPLLAQTELAAPAAEAVVARVNGVPITRGQLDEATREMLRMIAQQGQTLPPAQRAHIEENVLNQLVGECLMLEKCKALKIEDLDTRVEERVASLKKQFPDEKAFAEWLAGMRLDTAKLKEKIADGIRMETLIDREVKKRVKVTEADIQDFYDTHPEYFQQPAQVRASHILVTVPEGSDDKTKAAKRAAIDKARARVVGGEDFAVVAAEVSECPSKSQGGDLGFFGPGQMVKPFEEAAFALKSNEISEVVTTQFGYHVIKQTGSKPASTVPLAQEQSKIERFLTQQKTQQAMLAYIEELKKDAQVEVLLK